MLITFILLLTTSFVAGVLTGILGSALSDMYFAINEEDNH